MRAISWCRAGAIMWWEASGVSGDDRASAQEAYEWHPLGPRRAGGAEVPADHADATVVGSMVRSVTGDD